MRRAQCPACNRRQTKKHDHRIDIGSPWKQGCKKYPKMPYDQREKMKIREARKTNKTA